MSRIVRRASKSFAGALLDRRFGAIGGIVLPGRAKITAGRSQTVSPASADQRRLDMTDHIMKTLLNIMAALSFGAIMVLFVVL